MTSTDHESRLRAALEAGPTSGPWECFYKQKYDEWHVSLPLPGQSMRLGLFPDGCPTERAEADATYIAAANPEAIRSLLDEFDALRATTSRGDSAKRLSDAPAELGVERLSGGWKLVPKGPTAEMLAAARDWSAAKYGKPIGNDAAHGCYAAMLAAAPLPDAPVTQGHSHGSEQDGETQ